jgi:hypothetical protein
VDLVGLRKFTDESVKAGAKFNDLSQDIYRACAVELYYQKYRMSRFTAISIFESPDVFLGTLPARERVECETAKKLWGNFAAANKVLMSYLYVMGQLAGDDIANADAGFKAAKNSIASLPRGSDPIIAPTLNIANTITNILMDAERQKAIKKVLIQNNGDVRSLTAKLSKALITYIVWLEKEKAALTNMYNFALANHQSFNRQIQVKPIPSDALLVLSASANLEIEVQKINAKIRAAKAYQNLLTNIKDGHRELYEEALYGFNKKVAVRIALKYAPAIQANFDDINKAF